MGHTATDEQAAARISGLAEQLRSKGYKPQIPPTEPWQAFVPGKKATVHVKVQPLPSDQDRLWYFGLQSGQMPPGEPISAADGSHDQNAVIAICERAGPPHAPLM